MNGNVCGRGLVIFLGHVGNCSLDTSMVTKKHFWALGHSREDRRDKWAPRHTKGRHGAPPPADNSPTCELNREVGASKADNAKSNNADNSAAASNHTFCYSDTTTRNLTK